MIKRRYYYSARTQIEGGGVTRTEGVTVIKSWVKKDFWGIVEQTRKEVAHEIERDLNKPIRANSVRFYSFGRI